jgi:hypothetical protein
MIETIAAVIGGGLAVTAFFMARKEKTTDIFTIKSDKVSVVESNIPNPGSKPPQPRPQAPERFKMQSSKVPKNDKALNMSDISGIRLEGSGNVALNNGKLFISDNSDVYVKSKTLWIKTVGNTIATNKGIFSSSQNYSNTTNIEVPLVNFNSMLIDRVSLNGSGDIDISNMTVSTTLDILVKGSGDITLNNIITKELELTVKGSGDIKVDKKCRANNTNAILQGSGDITIKSIMVGTILKKQKGSGDIHIPTHMSSSKYKQKSYFRKSLDDGRNISNLINITYD